MLEEYLLALAFYFPKGISQIAPYLDYIESKEVQSALADSLKDPGALSNAIALSPNFKKISARAAFFDEIVSDPSSELLSLLQLIKRRSIQSRLRAIEIEIKKAEQHSDTATVGVLLAEFNLLTQQLTNGPKEKKQTS
jgi:hypothetical protein